MSDNPAIKLRNKTIHEVYPRKFRDIPLKPETYESLKEMNMALILRSINLRFDGVYDILQAILDILHEFKVRLDEVAPQPEDPEDEDALVEEEDDELDEEIAQWWS